MHAHFVLAHPEPKSFNAHLVSSGVEALAAEGWTTSISDLYAMGFDPCERADYFSDRVDSKRFDIQSEQRHASDLGAARDRRIGAHGSRRSLDPAISHVVAFAARHLEGLVRPGLGVRRRLDQHK
jgi:hypothetical protein